MLFRESSGTLGNVSWCIWFLDRCLVSFDHSGVPQFLFVVGGGIQEFDFHFLWGHQFPLCVSLSQPCFLLGMVLETHARLGDPRWTLRPTLDLETHARLGYPRKTWRPKLDLETHARLSDQR